MYKKFHCHWLYQFHCGSEMLSFWVLGHPVLMSDTATRVQWCQNFLIEFLFSKLLCIAKAIHFIFLARAFRLKYYLSLVSLNLWNKETMQKTTALGKFKPLLIKFLQL